MPNNGKLQIELYGELAALINLGNQHPRSKGNGGASNAGCGGSKPPIPNTLPLHVRSAETGPNQGHRFALLPASKWRF
jgi:hypothetical protein